MHGCRAMNVIPGVAHVTGFDQRAYISRHKPMVAYRLFGFDVTICGNTYLNSKLNST